MSVFVECKPDETLVIAVGVARRHVEHALNRSGVCAQLARRNGVIGLVDEDPDSARPHSMRAFVETSWQHEVRALEDAGRGNRLVMVSPRLEEWLVKSAKEASLKMTDYGFEDDNGLHLHREVNHRLENLKRLIAELIQKKSPRLMRLQDLIRSR